MNIEINEALNKISGNDKSLNMYVDILRRKISNATDSIKSDEEELVYIKERMEQSKATLEADKQLLEGLEAVISLAKAL